MRTKIAILAAAALAPAACAHIPSDFSEIKALAGVDGGGEPQGGYAGGEEDASTISASIYQRLWDNDEGRIPPLLMTSGGARYVPQGKGQPELEIVAPEPSLPKGKKGSSLRITGGFFPPLFLAGLEYAVHDPHRDELFNGMAFGLYIQGINEDGAEAQLFGSHSEPSITGAWGPERTIQLPVGQLVLSTMLYLGVLPGPFASGVDDLFAGDFGFGDIIDNIDRLPNFLPIWLGVGAGVNYMFGWDAFKLSVGLRYIAIPSPLSDSGALEGGLLLSSSYVFGF